jgi:cyclopropane-fatty-acyl-phospholipid synthase
MRAWLATALRRRLSLVGVRLRVASGPCLYDGPEPAIGELVVNDVRTLVALIFRPDLYFGEAYAAGRLEVRGNLEKVLEALGRLSPAPSAVELVADCLESANTLTAARRNVHHHYDLGNEFYRAWLDAELVYTCAYYAEPQMSLDAAQTAKLDLICRKLRLRPGERVLEAGCGWGALALHMARTCGARVKAYNVSREQIAFARERAVREGLAHRVEFIDDDYRNVNGTFDAFVSVGMLEHVGRHDYGNLGRAISRTVGGGGRGLLHFIGRDAPRPLNAWIRRRIFPGAYTPTLGEVTNQVLMPAGMSVLDVENLRLHYARTLRHWAERFARIGDQVRERDGEEFRRAWELYLAGAEAAFATGSMQLFQILFVPSGSEPPYWNRAEIYDDARSMRWFTAMR